MAQDVAQFGELELQKCYDAICHVKYAHTIGALIISDDNEDNFRRVADEAKLKAKPETLTAIEKALDTLTKFCDIFDGENYNIMTAVTPKDITAHKKVETALKQIKKANALNLVPYSLAKEMECVANDWFDSANETFNTAQHQLVENKDDINLIIRVLIEKLNEAPDTCVEQLNTFTSVLVQAMDKFNLRVDTSDRYNELTDAIAAVSKKAQDKFVALYQKLPKLICHYEQTESTAEAAPYQL